MTVRYSMLSAMLLNELQKQSMENARQAEQIKRLSMQIAEVKAEHQRKLRSMRTAFEERLSALEQTIQAKDGYGKLAAAAP